MVRLTASVTPSLLARDLEETIAFYCDLLGSRLTGSHPVSGEPKWIEVCRDDVVLQFYSDPPVGTPTSPVMSGTLYLAPVDVAALAQELDGRIALTWGPEVMEYGRLECAVRDPNGYFIAFSQAADQE